MERCFRAMGTEWWLSAPDANAALLDRAQALTVAIEARLSRFLPDSALSRLNRERAIEDAVVAEVVRAAEEMRALTAGAFDARVGAAVVAAGYDRPFEQVEARSSICAERRRPSVAVRGARVALTDAGALDLGGIAKGWAVDRVADLLLEAGACLVDGGGDIAVRGRPSDAGEWLLGVGDGLAIGLRDGAVATSSTLARRWPVAAGGAAHHIIDPSRGLPAEGVAVAVVVAPTAATADALATALVAGAARALPALTPLRAEALLQHGDGRWEMTSGMQEYLR